LSIRPCRSIAGSMSLMLTRRRGQSLRLVTEGGEVITVKVCAGHHPTEIKLAIDAPRSVKVERPERDGAPNPSPAR
jgi:sRNA-binding carbon storage regulator CsrA